MRKFVFAAAVVAALGATTVGSVMAQGCGGAGGMCAAPGAAGQQAMPGMSMQQATPGAPQQAAPGTGMMGGGMCGCCRQMAMMQPQPGAQGGTGNTPRPPSGDQPVPGGAPPAQ